LGPYQYRDKDLPITQSPEQEFREYRRDDPKVNDNLSSTLPDLRNCRNIEGTLDIPEDLEIRFIQNIKKKDDSNSYLGNTRFQQIFSPIEISFQEII
jgi:hypothetical protein